MRKIYSALGLILLSTVFVFGQKTDRMLEFSPIPPSRNLMKAADGKMVPTDAKGLELVEIAVEGKAVTPGSAFSAGDDWIKSLKIKFKNVSDKTISSVRASYLLPEAKYKETFLGFSLSFGSLSAFADARNDKRSIKPGEEFELMMSEKEYVNNYDFIVQRVGNIQITRAALGMVMVEFEDGGIWSTIKPTFAGKSE